MWAVLTHGDNAIDFKKYGSADQSLKIAGLKKKNLKYGYMVNFG